MDFRSQIKQIFRSQDPHSTGTVKCDALLSVLSHLANLNEGDGNLNYEAALVIEASNTSSDGNLNYDKFLDWLWDALPAQDLEADSPAFCDAVMDEETEQKWLTKAETMAKSLEYYTDVESLWIALETGSAVLISAKWMMAQADADKVLPRRQDLVLKAVLSTERLRKLHRGRGMKHVRAPVIAISYCWLYPEHPDPQGLQLKIIASVFRRRFESTHRQWEWAGFHKPGWEWEDYLDADSGVFLDWCSLFQEARTSAQLRSFKHSLSFINLWYAHQLTQVYMLTKFPENHGHVAPYHSRGWPTFERAISMLIKVKMHHVFPCIVDVGETIDDVRRVEPPMLPDAFMKSIADKRFTNGADMQLVVKKYEETMSVVLAGVQFFNASASDWTDHDVESFAKLAPLMRSVTNLSFNENVITGKGLNILANAGFPELTSLSMSLNPIDDKGILDFSAALGAGAFPKLEGIYMHDLKLLNETRDEWSQVCQSRNIKLCAVSP